MKRIIYITILTSLAIMLFTGCAEQTEAPLNENGTMETEETPDPLDEGGDKKQSLITKKSKEKYPTYDINAVEQSDRVPSLKKKGSYFMSQLDEKFLIVYNDIRSAYNKYQNELVLTKTVPPEDLFKIMSIMYIDDPEMFQMKPQYDYFLDSNKYVYKVKLYYSTDKMSYKEYKKGLEKAAYDTYTEITSSFESDPNKIETVNDGGTAPINETNLLTEQKVIETIKSGKIDEYASKEINTASDPSLISFFTTGTNTNSFTYAKYMTYMLRYMGMDAAVVIGKPTNESYANILTSKSNSNIESYRDVKKITNKKGSKYTVSYDFNDYIAWYIVKINDTWYHCDDIYNKVIMLKHPEFNNFLDSDQALTSFANDYLIAESRFFYQNDQILGDMPLCASVQFLDSYRKGIYLLNFTEEQTVSYISDVANILKSNEVKKLIYQFETEEGYQNFVKHFDEIIQSHNENSTDIIESYNIIKVPEALTILVIDFKYK